MGVETVVTKGVCADLAVITRGSYCTMAGHDTGVLFMVATLETRRNWPWYEAGNIRAVVTSNAPNLWLNKFIFIESLFSLI